MSKTELPKYVEDILDRVCKENGFHDYSLHVKPGSQAGDGFTTVILSVKISENGSEKSLDVVCKIAPLNKNRQKEFHLDIIFEREITFYQKVMPCFVKFQEEKGLSKKNQFLSYPKCYAALADHEKAQYVIILEDLRPQGYKLWNKAKPSPIENLRLVMQETGKLHAVSIAMKYQRPEVFAEFEKLTDVVRSISKTPVWHGFFTASYKRAIGMLKNEEDKNIIRDLKENWSSILHFCLDEKISRFAVMSHGDLWNSNLLYLFNEAGIAEDIRLLDWQVFRYTSPAIDLVNNIFMSTNKELRDKEYDNLIRLYHDSLAETVRLLGSNPDQLFTFNDLQNELKLFGKYAFMLAIPSIPVMLADPSELLDLNEVVDKAGNGEIRLDFVKGLNEASQLECERRMHDAIEDVIRLGYYKKNT